MSLKKLSTLTELVQKAENVDGKEIRVVMIDDVESKIQVRKRFRMIEELAESLKHEGLQSPIIVSPANAAGKYVIQKGERRWRAAKHAGFENIEVIINDKLQSDAQAAIGELTENIQRDNLTSMEIANAMGQLIDSGYKQVDIAKQLGKSRGYVSVHVGLLKSPECVLALSEKGLVEDANTLYALRQIYDLSPERCVQLCDDIEANGGVTRKEVQNALNALRQPTDTLSEKGQAVTTTETNDKSLVDHISNALPGTKSTDAGDEKELDSLQGAKVDPSAGSPNTNVNTTSGAGNQPEPSTGQQSKGGAERKGLKENETSKDALWVPVEEKTIVIRVLVRDDDGHVSMGRLMIDRIASDETQAWVMIDGDAAPRCVPIEKLQMRGVGTKNAH